MLLEDGIYTALLKGVWYRGVGEHVCSRPLGSLWHNPDLSLNYSKGVNGYKHVFNELGKNPLYVAMPLMAIMGIQSLYNYNQSVQKPANFISEISQTAFKRMLDNPVKTILATAGIVTIMQLGKKSSQNQTSQDKG